MNYRLQDVFRYIIPGLYVVSGVLFLCLPCIESCSLKNNLVLLKDFTSLIVLLVPFVGFVLGYFVECLMATIEHLYYMFGGRRPSKNILSAQYKLYTIGADSLIKINRDFNLRGLNPTNNEAGEILQIAKQRIDKEKVETFRINSILARNIFGGQLVITVVMIMLNDSNCFSDRWLIASCLILLLLLFYWIHHNHVYVKYVLAEYAKTLN